MIGPLLFIFYINEVTSIKLSEGSHLTVYADDILLYKEMTRFDQYAELQRDISNIASWVSANHLTLNTSKCKFMLVSHKRSRTPSPSLTLQDSILEQVDSFKYLGLIITNDLSWHTHISTICKKARKLLGTVYRKYYQFSNSRKLLLLYLTLIRPHLEYASPVWSPY